MNPPDLCESVSAATHGIAFFAAIPGTMRLARRAEPSLRVPILVYGVGLMSCFGASTLCHAFAAAGRDLRSMVVLDHMAIFALIAGTYTPIASGLLAPRRRVTTLRVIWLAAAIGIMLTVTSGPLPAWMATSFYLAMGWGGLWCYAGMRPELTHRQLSLVPAGGLLYSVGAIFHVTRRPMLWPGVFEAHELFHVFVVAGATVHFAFLWTRLGPGCVKARSCDVPPRPKLLGVPQVNRARPLRSR